MRRERDGDLAFLAQRFEQVPHGAAALRVESDSRLVEEQHVGRMNQAARDFEPAAHPARVSRDQIVGALGQPDHVQQAMSAFAALAARQAEELAVDIDVLPSGEIEIRGERLRDDADILAHLARMTRDVEAGDERLAAARRYQRREHPHHGRLAGAVGAEQSEDLAATDLEVDLVDGGESAEALSQVFGLYCC